MPNLKYLEVGVFEGSSLFWVLNNILTHESAHAYAIDFFDLLYHDLITTRKIFEENVKASGLEKKISFFRDFSHNKLIEFEDNFFDIIYIDGDHDAKIVYQDLFLSRRLLKPGGVLLIDDYLHIPLPEEHASPPKIGIDRFLEDFGDQYRLLYKEHLVVLEKL